MQEIIDTFVVPHDPLLGTTNRAIAPVLDEHNWTHRGLRLAGEGCRHYLYIVPARGYRTGRHYYVARVWDEMAETLLAEARVQRLSVALAIVNGEHDLASRRQRRLDEIRRKRTAAASMRAA